MSAVPSGQFLFVVRQVRLYTIKSMSYVLSYRYRMMLYIFILTLTITIILTIILFLLLSFLTSVTVTRYSITKMLPLCARIRAVRVERGAAFLPCGGRATTFFCGSAYRRSHVVAAVVFLERTRRQGEKKNLTGNGKLAIINRHSEMQSSCTGGGKRKNLTENRLCGIIGKAFMRK